jgi:hypothetical protein
MMQAEESTVSSKGMSNETWDQLMATEASKYDGSQLLVSVLEETEPKTIEQRDKNIEKITLPSSLLAELLHYTKNTLAKIRQINHDSVDTTDLESRKSLEITINQEIKETDLVLSQVLSYISILTPVIRPNSIHTILDEILEARGGEFYHKGIKTTKKYEKNLPETSIQDEEVKFIMNCIFQYASLSSSFHGRMGLFTRSVNIQDGNGDEKTTPTKEGGKTHVEIMVALMGNKEPLRKSGGPTIPAKGEETSNIMVLLLKDLVQRYQGLVGFEIIAKELLTVISVRLPIRPNLAVAGEPITM